MEDLRKVKRKLMNVAKIGYDSRAIANEILKKAQEKGVRLTIMQLVKLIYFAQGWSLALMDAPLSSHSAQAWQYGPVFPHVYKAFPKSGAQKISDLIINKSKGEEYSADLSKDEEDLIDWVIDEYGSMHAFELSKLTHVEGGPWKQVVDTNGFYSEIPNSLMTKYFKRFVDEAANA